MKTKAKPALVGAVIAPGVLGAALAGWGIGTAGATSTTPAMANSLSVATAALAHTCPMVSSSSSAETAIG